MKKIIAGAASGLAALSVQAQSTATRLEEGALPELEQITVSARHAVEASGLIRPEQATRSRSTVGHAYLSSQPAGQSVVQSLALVPGLHFSNTDAYGASGGNLRMRGFDGNRISLMVDGIPLNDSGNYAIYTGQLLDPEIIQSATVNLGTTDVDSPTASATGGTINVLMAAPQRTAALLLRPSVGSDDYRRLFLRGDTGEFGPWNTTGYASWSWQQYDKFKGPGQLQRQQFNARLLQDLGEGDFISLAVHFNRGRSHFYRYATAAQFRDNGWDFDNQPDCRRPVPVNGSVQDEADPAHSCANYYNVRINPSDTGNIRGHSSLRLGSRLRFTLDPSFQYVLANGGGYTVVSEQDMRLRGDPAVAGVDLNGDGDVIDRIALYTPNNTRTHRYGVNAALLWERSPASLLRLSYTFDRAWHRQTGEMGRLDEQGDPEDVFGGRRGNPVSTADGSRLRRRDRKSIALLNQLSLSYSARYRDDRLRLNLGLRAPFFERDLNQYCHTPVANPGGDPWCTTQASVGVADAQGYVRLVGSGDALYVPPYSGTKKYQGLLPSIGVWLRPGPAASHFFLGYSKGFSAPRNDNLYSRQIIDARPETTHTFELAYRHQGSRLLGGATLWKTDYANRIVSAWDEQQGIATDRNVGDVQLWGVDAAAGWAPLPGLSLYGAASYLHSRMQQDIRLNATTIAPTAGKQLVETPEVMLGGRVQYQRAGITLGLQARHVGRRWANDINTERAGGYTLVDLDAAWDFGWRGHESGLQLNVMNLFDRRYFGAISTSINGAAFYSAGAPRTIQLSWTLRLAGSR